MANVLNNTERLRQIKAELPAGSLAKIAKSIGVSRAAVTNAFNGKNQSAPILTAIFRFYVDWCATAPAPVEEAELDRLLQARQPKSAAQ